VISSNIVNWPHIDATTNGPNLAPQKDHTLAAPLDARRTAAIDSCIGKCSDKARKRLQELFVPIPTGTLEALGKHGLKINITQGKGPGIPGLGGGGGAVAVGAYNLVTRKIQMDESVLMADMGAHVILHESMHALDHMRGNRATLLGKIPGSTLPRLLMGSSPAESAHDKEFFGLYNAFNARANVEDIDVMRREVQLENDMKLPDKAKYVSDDAWGRRYVEYERKDGKEIFKINDNPQKEGKRIAGLAIGGALLAGGMIFGGPVMATCGGIFLGLNAVGFLRNKLHNISKPKLETEIDMVKGIKAHIVQQEGKATVTVPDGARSFTGDVWSDYAHRAGKIEEYAAEAYSTFLEGGDKAQLMKDADPNLYAFVEKRLQEEFNMHP